MTAAQLLALFNEMAGRATSDTISSTVKYQKLARAESGVITEIARVAPQVLYPKVGNSSMPQLTSVDGNVWTFGLDASNKPIVPFGDCKIYKRLTDIPDRPLQLVLDYFDEGDRIRLPRNRTFSGPLYWRGVVDPPTPISSSEDPHLIPSPANELTAIRAVQDFAETGNLRNTALADRMRQRWRERFPVYCITWKRQFSGGGALYFNRSLRDLVTPLL